MAIGGWLPWYRLLDLQLLWAAKHAAYFLPPLEYCQGYDDDDPVWHRREEGREEREKGGRRRGRREGGGEEEGREEERKVEREEVRGGRMRGRREGGGEGDANMRACMHTSHHAYTLVLTCQNTSLQMYTNYIRVPTA